jgi:nitrogen fixation protein NifU and related proteins
VNLVADVRDDLDMEYVLELASHFDKEIKPRVIQNPTVVFEDTNPLCGDKFKVSLRLTDDGEVEDIGFSGRGCAISKAAAYLLTEMVVGEKPGEVSKIERNQLIDEMGIEITSAVRLKCASLALRTLKKGITLAGHKIEEKDDDWTDK